MNHKLLLDLTEIEKIHINGGEDCETKCEGAERAGRFLGTSVATVLIIYFGNYIGPLL